MKTVSFAEVIDVSRFQILMQKYTDVTGVANAVLDLEGNVLVANGWQDICTRFHRVHPETTKRCTESDVALANNLKKGETYNLYRCLNGLVDVAVPIKINKKHVANLFTGQFFLEKPDFDFFRNQAKEFGFDEKKYVEALKRVPVFTEEQVKQNLAFLVELASFLGEIGLTSLNLQTLTEELEKRIEERTKDLKKAETRALNMMQEAVESRHMAEIANENLEKTMIELKRSNEELERFAYVASHDLQEPLRKIQAFGDRLSSRYHDALDERGQDYLERMKNASSRAQILISDLLTYSRIATRGQPFEQVDLSEIVKNILEDLEVQIHETEAVIDMSILPVIESDKTQMRQLFQNLIANAIKFRRSDQTPVVEIRSEEMDDRIRITVRDNGIGFDPQFSERIFILFQRLHNRTEYEGTGIGLAVCKKIVDRHHGEIVAESREGQGAVFIITLPKHQTEPSTTT